jgi:hypothetical protein
MSVVLAILGLKQEDSLSLEILSRLGLKKKNCYAGQLVECLHSMCEALFSNPSTAKKKKKSCYWLLLCT